MRRAVAAVRVLVAENDPARAARDVEADAAEPWLGRPVFPLVWLGATMQLAGGRIDAGRRLTDVAASVAAPDGWGEVAVAMLRSELALHDGQRATAERTALEGLAVAVVQDLRPWMIDAVEQLAFVDVASARLDRVVVLARAAADERVAIGYVHRLPHRRAQWQRDLAPLVGTAEWAAATDGLDAVVERLLRAGGRRTWGRVGWNALTPTELVVIEHVRDGLTNAAIAARMYVSPATVKSHLEHIYAKLGVHGRVELVAVASRHRDG
jgi:DNA-binding CsgD family transcriptional regulator